MRHALKAALVALTIIAPTREAFSAAITVHEPDGLGRVFVDVVGPINDEDFKIFKEKTDQIYPIGAGRPNKQMIVTLVSYGGHIGPALQIGDHIRKRGMSTFVPGDRTCTSACALIWLAGRQRNVGDTPQIGFHAVYDPSTRQETGNGNAVVGAYLRDLGIDYKAIVFMTRAGPTSVEWLTPDLAKQHGLAWAMLQPPRAIPIPPQPKLQPRLHLAPPSQVIAAWSRSARALSLQQPLSAPLTQQHAASPQDSQERVTTLQVRPVIPGLSPRQPLPTLKAVPPDRIDPADPLRNAPISPFPPPNHELSVPSPVPAAPPIAKIPERIEPSDQQSALPMQRAAIPTQKVVLYEEDPATNGKRFVGSVIWRTEMVTPAPGEPAELAIRADVEVPDRNLEMTWSLRRNTDKTVPATHVVEILFKLPGDFPTGGVSNVPGLLMKQGEQTRGVPLAGLAVKVTPSFYFIGLSNLEADKERNLQLLKERAWFDIPVVYNNSRRAILAMEKGTPGERVFAEAFKVWKQ